MQQEVLADGVTEKHGVLSALSALSVNNVHVADTADATKLFYPKSKNRIVLFFDLKIERKRNE